MKIVRRSAVIGLGFGLAVLGLAACEDNTAAASAEGEVSLGSADAPVTVVEYASVTCSACAAWNEQVWPEFKTRFVDTGQVRYVFREYPTPPAHVAVAGFLTARCAGEDRYLAMIDAMMRNQQAMVADPRQFLLDTARSAGLSEAEFDACVTDQTAADALNERVEAARAAGVTGTPHFLVDGEALGGAPTMANLQAAIEAAAAS